MIRRALIGAALATVVGGAAFADTPIGPGVTGLGGTGANATDFQLLQSAGAHLLRQDGMPADRASENVLASAAVSHAAFAAAQDSDVSMGVGMSSSTAARGSVGASVSLPGDLLD